MNEIIKNIEALQLQDQENKQKIDELQLCGEENKKKIDELKMELCAKENKITDRKSTRLNSSHRSLSRIPSSA